MTQDVKKTWERKIVPKCVHAFEMLDEIEKAKDDVKINLLKVYGAKSPLNFILSLNFNDRITLDLPEGMPPLKPDEMDTVTHPDFQGNLSSVVHRLKYCMPNSNLKSFKKEEIFIQVLLGSAFKDAEIVCFAKDKALEEMYPSITKELVGSVFPSYMR